VVIASYLLTRGTVYADLGPAYVDQRDRDAVRRLEQLGYKVTTEPAA